MSEVTDDHSPLNAGIDAIEASDARTSYAELSRSLRSIAQSIHLPLHVHLYSDMQQTGMPANFNDLRLNADVRLDPHPLREEGRREFRRRERGRAAPGLRRQEGARAGDRRRLRQLEGDAQRLADAQRPHGRDKPVEVPENGRATVEFLSLDVPYGRNKGEVRIDSGDSLPADDTFLLLRRARRPAPRAVRPRAGEHARDCCISRPRSRLPDSRPSRSTPATPLQVTNVSPSKYAFVVLSDVGSLPGGFENELRNYVRGGGVGADRARPHGGRRAARCRSRTSTSRARTTPAAKARCSRRSAWLDTSHPIDPEGRSLGRREVLSGDPGRARQRARGGEARPTRRRC